MLYQMIIICLGFTYFQTDWSGDSSVAGPVTEWQNNYLTAADILFSSGEIQLSEETVSIRHQISTQSRGDICVACGDISGSGYSDLASVDVDNGTLTWWKNSDGIGRVWDETLISDQVGGARFCRIIDLDSDSDQDIAVVASSDNQLLWFENRDGVGGDWVKHIIHDGFGGARALWEGDFNGDGQFDLAAVATDDNTLAVWLNQTSGSSWQRVVLSSAFSGAWSVHVGDFDGDSDTDVIAAALMGGMISWWENSNGLGTIWQEHCVESNYPGARSVHVFDADNDGDDDIVAGSISKDVVTLWENRNGLGTDWVKHDIAQEFYAVKSVGSCDVNRDGYADILGAAYMGEGLSWFENPGTLGEVWSDHPLTPSLMAASYLTASDVDSDGYEDVLGVSYNSDGIAWWDCCGYGNGSLTSSILDTELYPNWGTVFWEAETPPGTSVGVEVRASQKPDSMGSWSQTIREHGSLEGILAAGSRFMQYRFLLNSEDGENTPVLNHIEFVTTGASGIEFTPEIGHLRITSGNPSGILIRVAYRAESDGRLDLSVTDIYGRVVQTLHRGDVYSGKHSFCLTGLPSGTYHVIARCGGKTECERFTVCR